MAHSAINLAQRRITDERTSFRRLLSEARRELARYYLQEPSLGVGEIAYLLSYEDPGSFFRAFHEWEGKLLANGGPINGDCDKMRRKRLEESSVLLVWKKVYMGR